MLMHKPVMCVVFFVFFCRIVSDILSFSASCFLWFHNMKVYIASYWKAFIVPLLHRTTLKNAVSVAVAHCIRNRNNAALIPA